MRTEKNHLVKQISSMISSSDYVYFVSFSGLKVADMNGLRRQLNAQSAELHVLKNSLIRKAGAELGIDALASADLTLGTAMVYGSGDASAVAKTIQEFNKKNEKVAAKGGFVEGSVLSVSDVDAIASLPSKQVLQAMLLGVLQAPSRNLVTVLNAKAASILNVLNAYKDKKENNN